MQRLLPLLKPLNDVMLLIQNLCFWVVTLWTSQ